MQGGELSGSGHSVPGGRLPPHNTEAERSILGAILLNNAAIHSVVDIGLESRDFYREAHQKLIEDLYQKKTDVNGPSAGFHDSDRLTSGRRGGQLGIIAARPAMGKTSLVTSAVENIAMSSKSVVMIFSLEMSKEELGMRLLSG